MNQLTRVLLTLFLAAFLLVGLAGYQLLQFLRSAGSADSSTIVFVVSQGESVSQITTHLFKEGLLRDERNFKLYLRLRGLSSSLKVGEYALRHNMTPREIISVLSSGKSIEYRVVVAEGLNRYEIADRVGETQLGTRDEFLKLTEDPAFIAQVFKDHQGEFQVKTLEGFLFPETYSVTRAAGLKGLIRQMVALFFKQFAKVTPIKPGVNGAVNLNPLQLLTLASIVEKETGAAEERAMISSVFHNRMRKGMRLQTDPTVIYGIWSAQGKWNGNISRKDLQTPTAYNTYTISGLPPGPIANPGFEAMQAAANPVASESLYFVSKNNGTHVFTKDYSQHQKAVGEFQLNEKARQGKSWRDLKSK